MSKPYRVDRLNIVTHKWQRKKHLKPLSCRYLAKSQVVKCSADNISFDYINFRGSIFKNTSFNGSSINGCDFWGTSFNFCKFHNTMFKDCVFMGCRLRNCDFSGARFYHCVIVNTNLSECVNIDISNGIELLNSYPKCSLGHDIEISIKAFEKDINMKKTKLLMISGKKINHLNLYLLQRHFGRRLPALLLELSNHSTKNITTYKKLEIELKSISDLVII